MSEFDEYTAVDDPFPDATGLGERPDDPLRTIVTTIRISALDDGGYGFGYKGTVRKQPDSATDYPLSGRLHGYLRSGSSVVIVIEGTLAWLDTTAEMDTSVTIDDRPDGEAPRQWETARTGVAFDPL